MIAVLPPHCTPELLSDVRREIEARGWTCEVSAGADQTVLAVSGPDHAGELVSVLAPRCEADVMPLLLRRDYARLAKRRRIMHGIAWGLMVVIAFGLGYPILSYLQSPAKSLLAAEFVRVGSIEDLPANSARMLRTKDTTILLVSLKGERLFALSAVCTHMDDCQLEWSPERHQIVCPCHGGVYDVYGNVVAGPPSIPLTAYRVERSGNQVLVRTEP